MTTPTSQETLQKLALYATVKSRLANPEDVIDRNLSFTKLGRLYVKLRKELIAGGIPEKTLNTSGDRLSEIICDTLQAQHPVGKHKEGFDIQRYC